jgi:two-component sensor histidine kinase
MARMAPASPITQESPANKNLLAEANHRAANSLALLGGLVRMQARAVGKAEKPPTGAELRLMFDSIAARIATIGQLHRMLALMPTEGAIPLGPHLRDVSGALVAAFSSGQQPVHITHSGSECLVLTRHVQPLTLIMCEILTNAIKYAHPAGVAVHIAVVCDSQADGALFISISDDGVGLPEGFDFATAGSLGFQLIRALAAEIGARLEVRSDSLGVTFELFVPSALVANARSA